MKLFTNLKFAKADGTYFKITEKIKKFDLIVFDDFGLQHLDQIERLILLELLEDRHGYKSTIMISQIPIDKWHEVIGDQTIADAICDRLLHNSYRVNLKGKSMRLKNNRNLPES